MTLLSLIFNLSPAHLWDFYCVMPVASRVVQILKIYHMLSFPRINNCFNNSFQNLGSHFCALQVPYFNKQPMMHTAR